MRRSKSSLLAVAISIGLAASACSSTKHTSDSSNSGSTSASSGGSSSTGQQSYKQGGTLTIANEQGQTWPCSFNPFNSSFNQESLGFVYEPLIYVNILQDAKETPMLASGYQWNADKTQITFTVRDGAKWSDGQAITADDVAYTFNMMKQTPALDNYSLWSAAGLTSVTATGNQVTMAFKQNAQVYFYTFATLVGIVPKHIWSAGDAAAHPDTWADPNPIGSGPYTVKCTPNNMEYKANASYWQPGKPYVSTLEYPAYLDNGPANQDLASGKAQWGSQFITGIKSFYLNKSQDNHTWSPPVLNVSVIPNLDPAHKATSQLGVRQAIAYAIDKAKVSAIGEDGQEPPANQTGVITPTFDKYNDAAAISAAGYDKQDLTKAAAALATAGYSPSKPLNLTMISIQGYTDWDASIAVIKDELKPLGINITESSLTNQTYFDKLYKGDFDLAYGSEPSAGPSPYTELRAWLHSANTAPLGQSASAGNFERYKNTTVDGLLDQYASATSEDQQVALIKQVSDHMVQDLPIIPVTESADWFQYNTKDFGGWPTSDNPYAQPAAFNYTDNEQVLLHLYYKPAQ
jgi:peptide/nickel transport system substrate-binding protein